MWKEAYDGVLFEEGAKQNTTESCEEKMLSILWCSRPPWKCFLFSNFSNKREKVCFGFNWWGEFCNNWWKFVEIYLNNWLVLDETRKVFICRWILGNLRQWNEQSDGWRENSEWQTCYSNEGKFDETFEEFKNIFL